MQDFTPFYAGTPVETTTLPEGITFPVKYAVIRRKITNNTFGMVRRNRDGSRRPHQGWDFYAPPGYRCYAIADGEIAAVRNRGAYGKHVILKFAHDAGENGQADTLFAAYCHLKEARVTLGDTVKCGDVIGLCGESGNARGMTGTDAHLHFEIRTHLNVGRGLSRRMSPLSVFGQLPIDLVMVSQADALIPG